MTPTEINIEIARFCGCIKWEIFPQNESLLRGAPTIDERQIPNYYDDNNLISMAEKFLNASQRANYAQFILNELNINDIKTNGDIADIIIGSTASVKAKAFVKTIAKWVK